MSVLKRRRIVVAVLCAVAVALVGVPGGDVASAGATGKQPFASRVLAEGLKDPWEITWGPDGYLWVTEKSAGRVTRVRPSDGSKKTALTIPEVVATEGAQDGLLGMALHPQLLKGGRNQYVYVAYTYDADPRPKAFDRRAKIRRYTYDRQTKTLSQPADLITGLPASNDHNSGRLKFGPDRMLYYTIGDQGANQYLNYCKAIRSQWLPTAEEVRAANWAKYPGKVLRLGPSGRIPADNPVIGGVRSHIYTYGHRNAQGIVFGPGGRLYASEHGPKSDDELNILKAGGNYGWPRVVGYKDDKAYVYANWSASKGVPCSSLTYDDFVIPPSVPRRKETTFSHPRLVPPVKTFFTVPTDFNFQNRKCAESEIFFVCWPTLAPSSLDIYTATRGVPGWAESLLMPSLKYGTVYRVKLNAGGRPAKGRPVALWSSVNRYRDLAIKPDNKTFYVATDSSGVARDRAGRPTLTLRNPGSILEFRYRSRSG